MYSFVGDPPMSLLRVALEREGGQVWLRVGAAGLPPNERIGRLLETIRDSHAVIALPADDITLGVAGDKLNISATVQSHEWVGRGLQIGVKVENSVIRLRTQEHLALRIGDQLPVRLDFKRAHVFDAETGRSVDKG